MKMLIPLMENKGKESMVSEHFGHAPFFALFDTETKKLEIFENRIDHSNPSLTPVDQLMKYSPDMVYVKDIGQRAIRLFKEKDIALKTGDSKTVKDAIENIEKTTDVERGCEH